ncbi:MAG TPA: hypothetical protein VN048_10670 [Verrucomicrobiae bacterium]|jgi:hypothetical protein|nr:hypothetical protein [Verrucomicrobiae bacterium]
MDSSYEVFNQLLRWGGIPDGLFKVALDDLIDRCGTARTADLLLKSCWEVRAWKRGRRRPRPVAQAAVLALSKLTPRQIDELWDEMTTFELVKTDPKLSQKV